MRRSKAFGRSSRSSLRSSSRLVRGHLRTCPECSFIRAIKYRFEAFRQKFGRPPAPNEPLFFDPAYDYPVLASPKEIQAQLMAAAVATGVEPALVLKRVGRN